MKKFIIIIISILSVGISYSQNASSSQDGFLGNTVFADGIYTRNTSDFNNTFDYSSGGYLGYSIFLGPKNTLVFRAGYMEQNLKEGEPNFEGSSMNMIPLHFGGRYYFLNKRINPFVSFMNGANIINQKVNNIDSNTFVDDTIVRYVWQLGTGLTIGITRNLNFEISANYNSSFYTTDAMMTGFEYGIGFGYVLK